MALYTKLSRDQIDKLAFEFGLPPPRKFKGILEGTVNTYYKLTYPDQAYFLKIDEVGKLPRLQNELKILDLLHRGQKTLHYLTPHPEKTKKGAAFLPFNNKFVLLFKQVPGKSLMGNSLRANHIHSIGKALARMHDLKSGRPFSKPHRFHFPEMKRVHDEIKPRLQKKHPAIAILVDSWMKFLKSEEPQKIAAGLIHADLFPENIHFIKNKLVGILDFEAGGKGAFLFDIATTLHACTHNGKKFDLKRTNLFLKGYQSVRKLTSSEKKYFEYYLFQSALRFLLTRLRDFELKEGPVKAKPFKDYREFVKRLDEIPEFVENINL